MKINVVIPSKNGAHHLRECLPTVVDAAAAAEDEIKIIVVDDNSSDGTLQQLPSLFPSVIFVSNPSQGVCSARNFGVRQAPCDWICFLDNDVFLDKPFFGVIRKYLQDGVFCVTCAGYAAYPKVPGAREQLDGIKLFGWKRGFPRFTDNIYNAALPEGEEYPAFGVQGAYFMCNRTQFDALDGFDTLLEPYLLEETDLAYRGLKRGWKILYAPDTSPRHKCGGTINSKKSKRTQYLSQRNRILFVWKNIHSPRLLLSHLGWLALRPCPKAVWECLKLWPRVKASRSREKAAAVVSDETLLENGGLREGR